MKTTFYLKNTLKLAFMAGALFLSSCTEDNTLIETTEEEEEEIDYTITVNATNGSTTERTLDITAVEGTTVPVIVKFTKEDDSMDRLYVIQTLSGSTEGSVAYDIDPDDLYDLDTKLDGSLDLEGDQEDEFSFTINFPAPANDNATVQYVLWVTEGRGDYRDITNDNSFEDETTHAVITITAGTEAELSGYVEFTDELSSGIRLDFPYLNDDKVIDGSSKTFVSIFNGQNYSIDQGIETAALWDFGYHYGNTFKASFYSTSDYNERFSFWNKGGESGLSLTEYVDISESELNNIYFAFSDIDFDSVHASSDLDGITKPTNEYIREMEVGDVIEFVDQYGNKGLIKIEEIKGTNAGTKTSPDYIRFSVKAQANATPINL